MSEAKKEFSNLIHASINNIISRLAEKKGVSMEEAAVLADKQGIFNIAQEVHEEFLRIGESQGCDCGETQCEDCSLQGRNTLDWEVKPGKPKAAAKEDNGEELKDSDNPWALAHWMKNKSHSISGDKKKSKSSLAVEKIIISKAISKKSTGDKK